MRERTYFPQLCLVQVATEDAIFCIDPLDADVPDAAALKLLLDRPWTVHAGRQDIEVLYQVAARMPAALFDTQIAAGLLGYPPQIGYAGLVAELFDVHLPKSHTRADWSRRPLSDELLRYASDDVAYLLPAADRLSERLAELGRLEWAIEDSQALLDPGLYRVDPTDAIDRLKGARNLRGSARAAARRLATWREQRALDSDRPRQWIMKDAVLLDIATTRPRTKAALARIPGLAERTLKRAGSDILEALARAADDREDYRPPGHFDEAQKRVLASLKTTVAEVADQLGVSAEIVGSRKDLTAAIRGEPGCRLLSGWRAALLGDAVSAALKI